jgi:hypothetical protein
MTSSINEINRALTEFGKKTSKEVSEKVADYGLQRLKIHATAHKLTGDLALKGLKVVKNGEGFKIEGASRSTFEDGTYHPMFFITRKDGSRAVTDTINKMRDEVARLKL